MDVRDVDSEATLSDNDDSALRNALTSSSAISLNSDSYAEDQEVPTLFTHHFIPDREPAPFSQWDDTASQPHTPTPSPPSSITSPPSLPTKNDDIVAPKVLIR